MHVPGGFRYCRPAQEDCQHYAYQSCSVVMPVSNKHAFCFRLLVTSIEALRSRLNTHVARSVPATVLILEPFLETGFRSTELYTSSFCVGHPLCIRLLLASPAPQPASHHRAPAPCPPQLGRIGPTLKAAVLTELIQTAWRGRWVLLATSAPSCRSVNPSNHR
jgi:hypothetical protein